MNKKLIILIILIVLLVSFPFVLSGFWVRLVTNIFMFAVLASALNIISGFTGYAAFGNMVFFGVGAYTVAGLMNKLGFSFISSFIFAGLVSVLLALLLGMLLLRLKGHYFALATLGAAEAIKYIIDNLTDLTGGAQGTTIPSLHGSPFFVNSVFYFFMFALLIVIVAFTWWLSKSRLGYALKAIRANEEAAGVMGINTTMYKITAWTLSGLFTGLAGAVYAYWFSYIDPPTVFNVMWVVRMFVIILLGGAGTVFGPLIGAFILESLSELIWSQFLNLHLGILGTIIIITVLIIPNGIVSLMKTDKGLKGVIENIKKSRTNAL